MNPQLQAEIDGCRRAHQRLATTPETVVDDLVARPWRLSDWALAALPHRVADRHRLADLPARHRLCAWLFDRASDPGPLTLEPWE
jgi:hypothetical protein